jgi:hypothetical protein
VSGLLWLLTVIWGAAGILRMIDTGETGPDLGDVVAAIFLTGAVIAGKLDGLRK